MKAYWSLFKLRLAVQLQYRAAALASFVTNTFFGFVRILVYQAFYASSSLTQPMSFTQVATYTWLTQATFRMQPWNYDLDVFNLIRTGNVAYELCRPLNLYLMWYCRLLALRLVPTLLTGIPVFILALLLPSGLNAAPPPSGLAAAAWLLSTLGALLLGCAMTNVITLSALWTLAGDGMMRIFPAVVMILSGVIIPLAFFPDWLQPVLRILPFSGLVDIPLRFYLGTLPFSQLLPHLALQLAWTAVFVLIGLRLISAGMKQVAVQGG